MLQVFNFFRGREIGLSKKVVIDGFSFHIKKIDPLDHLKGLKVMLQSFDTYKVNKKIDDRELSDGQVKKVREHYRDIFLASVVRPQLSIDGAGETVCVNDIFKEGDLSEKLYEEIITYTYGKKKIQRLISAGNF